jgi:hypothetical protein
MKRLTRPIRILAAGILISAGASADFAFAHDDPLRSCRADYRKFCDSVPPGGGRIAACLKQHLAELSPSCQASMDTVIECGEQAKALCGADTGGATPLRDCMQAHAGEFSPACVSALRAR